MRYLFVAIALILSGTLFAEQDTNTRLLTEEERDARLREQQELAERAAELQDRQDTAQQLLRQQEQYLEICCNEKHLKNQASIYLKNPTLVQRAF